MPAYFSKNAEYDGQTAPPDMVFIQGKNEMESFYISSTEEPNINYVIYLQWLDAVFDEYHPEIIKDAMPKNYNNEFIDINSDGLPYTGLPSRIKKWDRNKTIDWFCRSLIK